MSVISNLARKQMYTAIDILVDRACKVYKDSTGNTMTPKVISFIKTMLMTSVDLIDQAATEPEKINLATIAQLAFKRAIAVTGFTLDEKNAMQCGVSLASLAVATVEYFGVMVASAGAAVGTGGAGALPAAAVMISATAFYGYQTNELVQQCGDAYVSSVEASIADRYNVEAKRQMVTNLSTMP